MNARTPYIARQLNKLNDLYRQEWSYINGPWIPGKPLDHKDKASPVMSHVPGVFFSPNVLVNDINLLIDLAEPIPVDPEDQSVFKVDPEDAREAVIIHKWRPDQKAVCFSTISSMSFGGWYIVGKGVFESAARMDDRDAYCDFIPGDEPGTGHYVDYDLETGELLPREF